MPAQQVYVDVIILSVLDLFASMLCAVTVFSVLGAMAHELGYDDIKNVVASGTAIGPSPLECIFCCF